MTFRAFIAVLAGKLIRLACRILHRGGTAKPGEIALKICPDLLEILSRNVKSIVITGTNGKTTSTRIVEEGFREAGLSCFANRSGANLIEGIATDFIMNCGLNGRCRAEYAILETDEYATKKVCLYLKPEVIYVTNIFLDQVDRFGGVLNTRDGIATGVRNSPESVLVLNADCMVTASIAKDVPNRVIYYGLGPAAAEKCGSRGVSDVAECPVCGGKVGYGYVTFSHLGAFSCPDCGFSRPTADFEVSDILSQTLSGSEIKLSAGGEETELRVNLPAVYNIYNAVGAIAALSAAGVDRDTAVRAAGSFNCGFGRMEKLNLGKKGARMILVKNNAGCDQVIAFLRNIEEEFVLWVYLNNRVSDGVDISWLEMTDFESLNSCRVREIYVSGDRADEMHDRLLKAGLPEEKLHKEKNCRELVGGLKSCEVPVFIMPTYTGMIEARNEIIKQCGGTEFWEG